jgi:type I restriction enzyme S subunit
MKRIGDVCDVVPGFAFKSKDLGETGITVIKIGNITENHTIDIHSAQRIPVDLVSEKHKKFFLQNGDILIAMTGATAGKVGRIRCPEDQVLLLNQRVAKFSPKAINPDFFWCTVSSDRYRKVFYGLGGGAAQPNMSGAQIESVEIPYPPLAEQDRMASTLTAYDELIENNRRRIALLEQAARLLYKEWFVNLRFPGHEHINIIDGVPEGWQKTNVGTALTLQRGFDLPVEARKFGSIPIYASTGVHGYHDVAKVQGPGVVTGRSGSLGTVIYVTDSFWPLNTTLWVKEFKRVSPIFAYHLLLELKLEQYAGGAAVPTLNRNDVHRIDVLIPSYRLIDLFSETVTPFYQQISKFKKYSDKLKEARDLILPRLMNGEIVI